MCASCEPGYWKNEDTFTCYECEKTSDRDKMYMLCSFFIVLFILYQLFDNSKDRTNAELIAIIRITISTIQFLFLLSKLQAQETPIGAAS